MTYRIYKNTKYGVLKITLDANGLEMYQKYNWCVQHYQRNKYLYRNIYKPGNKCTRLYFAREIVEAKNDLVVDHINHDGLDNRRVNLRQIKNSDNIKNQLMQSKRSGKAYKGVYINKVGNWRSVITSNGNIKYLGTFNSRHAAAIAYNIAAKIEHKEFAVLNRIGSIK